MLLISSNSETALTVEICSLAKEEYVVVTLLVISSLDAVFFGKKGMNLNVLHFLQSRNQYFVLFLWLF